MKKNLLIFRTEEILGGYDLDILQKNLEEFFKNKNIDFILLNANISPLGKDDVKKLIRQLKELLK